MQTLTKFFLILSTVSFFAFGGEIIIVATVNQTPITNVDMHEREEILETLMSQYTKYSIHERQIFAMQHLVQDALKQEYLKRIDFKATEEEKKQSVADFISILQNAGVKNTQDFIKKYQGFFQEEILWQAFVSKTIKPAINIIDEIVEAVHVQKPEFSKEKIRVMLVEQQVQSHTSQLIESMRNVSVIEIKTDIRG